MVAISFDFQLKIIYIYSVFIYSIFTNLEKYKKWGILVFFSN